MTTAAGERAAIARTERGLTISGTRITLYQIMDYLLAGWPHKLIRDRLNLSEQQLAAAIEYIDAHRVEVDAEYQQVLETAQEIRQYWEERNRERLAEIAAASPAPGQEALRARLEEWKHRIDQAE